LSSRCTVIEGDFFDAVPQADIHILKHVIHNWDDEQSVRILSNCARTLQKNGRVVLIERVAHSEHETRSSTSLVAMQIVEASAV